jgi:hypothetical protein
MSQRTILHGSRCTVAFLALAALGGAALRAQYYCHTDQGGSIDIEPKDTLVFVKCTPDQDDSLGETWAWLAHLNLLDSSFVPLPGGRRIDSCCQRGKEYTVSARADLFMDHQDYGIGLSSRLKMVIEHQIRANLRNQGTPENRALPVTRWDAWKTHKCRKGVVRVFRMLHGTLVARTEGQDVEDCEGLEKLEKLSNVKGVWVLRQQKLQENDTASLNRDQDPLAWLTMPATTFQFGDDPSYRLAALPLKRTRENADQNRGGWMYDIDVATSLMERMTMVNFVGCPIVVGEHVIGVVVDDRPGYNGRRELTVLDEKHIQLELAKKAFAKDEQQHKKGTGK